MKNKVEHYKDKLASNSPEEIIQFFAGEFPGKIKFASSLGLEDQVITHMISSTKADIGIFTLDTGRMFQETYNLVDRTREKYGISIEIVFPDRTAIEKMVTEYGANLFYESTDNRKLCCKMRKTEPSKRIFSELNGWITGLRREQSVSRLQLETVEWDEENSLIKINPLSSWDLDHVWAYILKNNIPYNPLHDKGFPSIGCLPCTRAVKSGENIRSGRWWWEDPDKKECGLHK